MDVDDGKLHDTSLEESDALSMLDKPGEGLQLEGAPGGLLEVKKKPKRVRIGMGMMQNMSHSNICLSNQIKHLCNIRMVPV